jgi:hypothetical protein
VLQLLAAEAVDGQLSKGRIDHAARDRIREAAPDGRRHHEAVAAEAGGEPQPFVLPDRAQDRLVVGSNVVEAFDEEVEGDELELRQQ